MKINFSDWSRGITFVRLLYATKVFSNERLTFLKINCRNLKYLVTPKHIKLNSRFGLLKAALSFIGLFFAFFSNAQGVFTSAADGDWDDTSSWTFTGTDADGIPDADDDVTVQSIHTIDVDPTGTVEVLNLTIEGTLAYTGNNRTLNVGGNLIMNGNSSITGNGNSRVLNVSGSFTVSSGATSSIAGQTITVTGTTTLSGSLTITNNSGTKTFSSIVVDGTGSWINSSTESFTINGDITNNGAWTGCSGNGCLYDLTSSSGTISGSSTTTFADLNLSAPASFSNSGDVVITDDFTGDGTFSNASNGSLELSGSGPYSLSNVDFSANPNTVTYSGSGNVSAIFSTTYHDLIINKNSGNRAQIAGDVTVNNDFSIDGGELRANSGTTTVSGDVIIQGGEFAPNNAAFIANIDGDLLITSGFLDFNNGTVTVTGALEVQGGSGHDITGGSLSVGTFTVDNGQEIELGSNTFTVSGATTLDGTLTIDGSGGIKTFDDITINATGSWNNSTSESFTINGSIVSNGTWNGCSNTSCLYELTNSSGSISGATPISFADLNIDSPGAYTSTTSITITDDLTGTGSFTNANGSSLELSGGGPFSIATLNASAAVNTVSYTNTGANPINPGDYYNLTIDKEDGVNMTVEGNVNVLNDLVISGGILTVQGVTLDVTNDVTISGGELSPNNAATVVNIDGDLTMSSGIYDQNNGDVNVTGNFQTTGGTITMNSGTSSFDMAVMSLSNTATSFSGGTLNVNSGDFSLSSGSTLTLAGTAVAVSGDFDIDSGPLDFNSGSLSATNVDLASGVSWAVGNSPLTFTGTAEINGDLTYDNGAAHSFDDINVNASGSWNNTLGADFTISGNILNNGTNWTGCNGTGCDYTLTSTSGTISGSTDISFSDLIIDGFSNYTTASDLNIDVDDRIIGTGALTLGTNNTLNYGGNNFTISNFTASASGVTVIYDRAGDQSLAATTDNQYFNLVINTDEAGDDVTLLETTTITNSLTLTVGDLRLSSFNLILNDGVTISGGGEDSHIALNNSGIIRQFYSGAGATLSFPMGDTNDYSPINSLRINSATFGAGAYLDLDVIDSNNPNRNVGNEADGGDDSGDGATDFLSRYWTITANNITDPDYDVSYTYVEADVNTAGGMFETNLVGALYREVTFGGNTFNDWWGKGIVNPVTNTVTFEGADNWGELYAMDNNMSRLPVELISFEAKSSNEAVVLSWTTATEENNSHFNIERSFDGLNWNEIGQVQGNGTSSLTIDYTFIDSFPLPGRSYYRLKQVDYSGLFEFSKIVVVHSTSSKTRGITFYPSLNEAGGQLYIQEGEEDLSQIKSLSLISTGGVVYELELKGNAIELPAILTPGVYVIQLALPAFSTSQKLVVR